MLVRQLPDEHQAQLKALWKHLHPKPPVTITLTRRGP
jgi:hypothetical protein